MEGPQQQILLFDEHGNEPDLGPVQRSVPQFLNVVFRHLQKDDFHVAAVLPELFETIIHRLKYVDFIPVQYLEHFAEEIMPHMREADDSLLHRRTLP